MRPMRMRGGHLLACVALVGWALGACSDSDGDGGMEIRAGCDPDAPVVAFDHETTDPDRGIGGGVPEVSVLSGEGRLAMITGSWVASQATFSPDGEHLAVVKADGDYESAGPESTALWVVGTDGSDPRELTGGDVLDEDPDWSADGSSVVFVRTRYENAGYRWSIDAVPADGGEPVELFDAGEDSLDQPVWSPDGKRIAFVRSAYGMHGEVVMTLWTMAADGSFAQPLVKLPHVGTLDWHPSGTSLLVDSDAGTEDQTFLVDAETGQMELVGTGADLASWSPDGRGIYYFRREGGPDSRDWSIVEGHLEQGALVEDRTVLAGGDLVGTVLSGVGLHPGFDLAVGPCA